MTSTDGSNAQSGSSGRWQMGRCRFAKAHACEQIVEPVLLARDIAVTYCTAGAAGRGFLFTYRRIWFRMSNWRWQTAVD